MAEPNQNFGEQPPGEGNPAEGPREATSPRHTPHRVARPIYEETPEAHAQPLFGNREIPSYARPSSRFMRHVAYLNARVLREATNSLHHYQQLEMPPPVRRLHNRGRPHSSPPPSFQPLANNAHASARHRFRGPIGRYANAHFGPGAVPPPNHRGRTVNPDGQLCDHEDPDVSKGNTLPPPRPLLRFYGSYDTNPEIDAPPQQRQYRGFAGEYQGPSRYRHGGFYHPDNSHAYYQQPPLVPQIPGVEMMEVHFPRDDVLQVPSTVPAQFSYVCDQACSPPGDGASHSQLDPSSPFYSDCGNLCTFHSSVVDYCYPFEEPPIARPMSMFVPRPPVTYPYISSPSADQPPYLPYYSSPSTSYSQGHTSLSYPYTYPYSSNFYPQTTRPFHPFHENTFYPPNPSMAYFFSHLSPSMHYPAYAPNGQYRNYQVPTEQFIIPIRLTPPVETTTSSSEENASPPTSPPENLQLMTPTQTIPSAAVGQPAPGQNSFIHTFVPSTRFPPRNIQPPFTSIGISAESRRHQVTGNLYYFCDVAANQLENDLEGPGYFLYECSTCLAANQPCHQWVMVTPRRFPTSQAPAAPPHVEP